MRFDKLKEFLFYTALLVILVPTGLIVTVALSDYYHAKQAVESLPKSDEKRRIEYYMHNDIMYINIDQFEIEFESTDSVLKFESFDSLAYYVSEASSKEAQK